MPTDTSLPEAGIRLLPESPKDGITSLCYLDINTDDSSSSLLASTSWDGCLRIHDTGAENSGDSSSKLATLQNMESGPLLALSKYNNPDTKKVYVYTGGLDGSIKRFDIDTSQVATVGYVPLSENENEEDTSTDAACSCMNVIKTNNADAGDHIIASAGWNSKFYLWDAANLDENGEGRVRDPIFTLSLPDKAFSMDVDPSNSSRIAISTAGRKLIIIDIDASDPSKPMAKIVLQRESSLKFQSRICRFFPTGIGLAIGSIEGRVAIEFLAELDVSPPEKMKKYAFKCHRKDNIVYPVNAIAFHPSYGTFATGGCDGTVVTWDGLHKKKLVVLPKFPQGIAALAFNGDGSELAIASSYTFEEGDKGNGEDDVHEIYVKKIIDSEVRPKGSK